MDTAVIAFIDTYQILAGNILQSLTVDQILLINSQLVVAATIAVKLLNHLSDRTVGQILWVTLFDFVDNMLSGDIVSISQGIGFIHKQIAVVLVELIKITLGTGQFISEESQFRFLTATLPVESLTLRLQSKNTLLQLGTVKQVGITAGNGDILLEVHAVLFVLTAHVEVTLTQGTALHLMDEFALGLKQIEIIAVKTTLDGIDKDHHLIISIELGNLVALTDTATVALLHVGRTPWQVKMMDGNATLLGIDTSTKGRGAAKQYADITLVHLVDILFTLLLATSILYKGNLVCGNAILIHKTILQLLID